MRATAEPLIACNIAGSAEFQEREIGGAWLPRRVRRGASLEVDGGQRAELCGARAEEVDE